MKTNTYSIRIFAKSKPLFTLFFFFVFLSSISATISSLSPSIMPLVGGQLTINGTGFGSDDGLVTLNNNPLTPTSWKGNEIIVNVPSGTDGQDGSIKVFKKNNTTPEGPMSFVYGAVLAVELSDFSIQKNSTNIVLKWTSSTKDHATQIDIERSTSLNNQWSRIETRIQKQDVINQANHWKDDIPAKGINYYRLKFTEINGKTHYSKVKSVQFDGIKRIAYGPNPVHDVLVLYNTDETEKIYIVDTKGQVLKQTIVKNDVTSLPVEDLPNGFYFIRIQSETDVSIFKFYKTQ